PPSLYAWLEWRNNKMIALCRAERGTPAANLSWSYTGSSEPAVKTQLDTDGFVTVESQLELLEDINLEDLTCIIQHRYWDQEKILVPKPREANYSPLLWIRVALVIILILSGFLALKKCHPPLQNTSQPKIPALDPDNIGNGKACSQSLMNILEPDGTLQVVTSPSPGGRRSQPGLSPVCVQTPCTQITNCDTHGEEMVRGD
ncbi:hypothetical protein AMECASPLE_038051, partial [Ameca splendens]